MKSRGIWLAALLGLGFGMTFKAMSIEPDHDRSESVQRPRAADRAKIPTRSHPQQPDQLAPKSRADRPNRAAAADSLLPLSARQAELLATAPSELWIDVKQWRNEAAKIRKLSEFFDWSEAQTESILAVVDSETQLGLEARTSDFENPTEAEVEAARYQDSLQRVLAEIRLQIGPRQFEQFLVVSGVENQIPTELR